MTRQPPAGNRFLLVGSDWMNDLPGGLNRYFSDLLTYLTGAGLAARGLVVGPAEGAPPEIKGTGRSWQSLPRRLFMVRRTALQFGRDATLVDAHFALYALPLLTTRLGRRPLVVHFQGPWADESARSGTRRRLRLRRAIERAVYRRAAECVTLSSPFRRILIERYRVTPWRISVIPPGVDLGKFSPGDSNGSRERLGIPAGAWTAFAARRFVPRTGVDVLLQAWADATGGENEGKLLLLAGEGELSSELQGLAKQLGAPVRFLGSVDDETLVDCYRAADVSVVPSVELEGFGLVVLESLACGTPVIATTAGGLPEAVGPLGKDFLAQPGDAKSLAAVLSKAVQGDGLPDRASCRTYAEKFSWQGSGRRNLDLYRRAIHPPRVKKLRVVYLDHTARFSGGELALLRLLSAMPDVDAHVILAEDGPLVGKLSEGRISVEVMPMQESGRGLSRHKIRPGSLPGRSFLASGIYTVRLAAWLRKLSPDVVHTNSLKAAIYGAAAARLARVPLVWHIRDSISEDYLPKAAVAMIRAMARTFPAGVIANSRGTLASLGPLTCPAVAIPSPLEGSPPHQRQRSADNASLSVAMVGRIAPWKGQDLFLEAFAHALSGQDHRGVIAGSPLFGEEPFEEDLKRYAADLGLDGRVDFRGFVEEVPQMLSEMDILVHASRIPEPFGLTVVEGMAAGLPVVAAAAGGPAEVIEDGKTGLLYPPGNPAALAAALKKLAEDQTLRARLGDAARVKAQEFSPDKIAAQVLEFYNRLEIGASRSRIRRYSATPGGSTDGMAES